MTRQLTAEGDFDGTERWLLTVRKVMSVGFGLA